MPASQYRVQQNNSKSINPQGSVSVVLLVLVTITNWRSHIASLCYKIHNCDLFYVMCSSFPDYGMCTCPKVTGRVLLHKRIVHAPVLHSDLIDNVIHNNVTKHQLLVHTC